MPDITLQPISKPFAVAMTPPGSKSLTNRALLLAALGDGVSDLTNVLFADDTLVMLECLERLGFRLGIDRPARAVRVHGSGGRINAETAELFCGNSGTSIRFLTALCCLGRGQFTLDGIARMRQRPIGELVDLLQKLGGKCEYLMEKGFPPLRVMANQLSGGVLTQGAAASSQYLSAVLMVSPYAQSEVHIELEGPQTSWPYVAMTMRLMDLFGVTPELIRDDEGQPRRIVVPQDTYHPARYTVEPDASNASYFLAAAALHPGSKVTIEGLGKGSLQGDVGFADILEQMGAGLVFGKDFITVMGTDRLQGIDVDLSGMPDTAQTLAVAALFAKGTTTIRGLGTLRVKETDRLAALSVELRKLGAAVEVEADTLAIAPPAKITPGAVDTYDDHRMAMSFALAGTRVAGITIKDAQCVNKTYPEFFEDLAKLGSVGGSPDKKK